MNPREIMFTRTPLGQNSLASALSGVGEPDWAIPTLGIKEGTEGPEGQGALHRAGKKV